MAEVGKAEHEAVGTHETFQGNRQTGGEAEFGDARGQYGFLIVFALGAEESFRGNRDNPDCSAF